MAEIVNLLISGEMDFSVYLQWGLIGLIAYFARSVFHGLSTRCSHEATFRVLSEMRRTIAEKLTRVPMGYLTATPSGRLKTTMVERIEQMEVPLAHIIPEMTANLLVPVALVVYLFVLDWRMALASLATIPLGMLCYMAQMKEYPKKICRSHAGKQTYERYHRGIRGWHRGDQSVQSERGVLRKIHRRCPAEHAAHAGVDEIDARLFCVDDDTLAGCSDRCASCGVSALSEWQPFSVGF